MDPFSRYLLALHLAFAMPDAPPAIFTPPGVPSPSAPGAVHAVPSPSPATPAVIHAPPVAGGGSLIVSGSTTPATAGEYLAVETAWSVNEYEVNPQRWTTNGASSIAPTGAWGVVYKWLLQCYQSATLEAIAPKANYMATGSQSTASTVSVLNVATGWKVYWLFDDSGTPRWVDAADGGLADQGSTVISAGTFLSPQPRFGTRRFIGGLGRQWEDDNRWAWALTMYSNGGSAKSWAGRGESPSAATWLQVSAGITGIPSVASSGLTVPPVIHFSPGLTPGTPGAIHSAPARTPGNPPVITP